MRFKTQRDQILDIERYCNKMLANEANRDKNTQKNRENIEVPLSDREYNLSDSRNTIEECIFDPETHIIDWSEMMENEKLYIIFKSLSEKEQAVLYYYAIYGFSHKEIAVMFACPRQSITRIINRCRKRIKNALQKQDTNVN